MQVSWIDPEEIRTLIGKLEGPRKASSVPAWEVHTLPVQPLPAPTAESIFEAPKPVAKAEPAPPPRREISLGDSRPGPAAGEIWSIREQLRSLREKAEESGIVRAVEKDDAAEAPAPSEPVIQIQPEPVAEAPAVSVSISNDASSALEELLTPLGPIAAAPPPIDPASLPQPIKPPPTTSTSSIEYAGPAPSAASAEPLFSSSTACSASVESVVSPEPIAASAPIEEVAPAVEDEAAMDELLEELTSGVELSSPFSLAEEFDVPALGLSDRLDALARWAQHRLGTEEILLVDDYGDVLWGGQAHTSLVLAAMMAWHSSQRSSAESATLDTPRIDKEINPGRHLTVIPMRSRFGTVSLAAIRDSLISDEDVSVLRRALLQAVEGPEA